MSLFSKPALQTGTVHAPGLACAASNERFNTCGRSFLRFSFLVMLAALFIFGRPGSVFASGSVSVIYPEPAITLPLGWGTACFAVWGNTYCGVKTAHEGCIRWANEAWTFTYSGQITPVSQTQWKCPSTRDGQPYDVSLTLVQPATCPVPSSGPPYVWDPNDGKCKRSACPENAAGNPLTNPASCTCNDPYVPDPAGKSCVPVEEYSLELTIAPTDKVEPSGSATLTAAVKDAQGQGKSGVTVSIKVEVEAGSGGHDHHDQHRSKGALTGSAACEPRPSCATAITDVYGIASFTFTAPEVSGKHTFAAACISPACKNDKAAKIDVKVDGLEKIPASQFYTFIGAKEGRHTNNHYLTPPAELALHHIALSYQWLDYSFRIGGAAPPPLHLNDASLVWGGRFDKNGDWASPHGRHRRGVVIDVRANAASGAIPLASFGNFIDMAATQKNRINKKGADAQVHCTSNRADGQNRQPPTCIGRDGSQDSNRHFHILLLGVDQ